MLINGHAKGEDALIRRLGMAVAGRWGAIPPFAQDEILEEACEIETWPVGEDVREALEIFLNKDVQDRSPLE